MTKTGFNSLLVNGRRRLPRKQAGLALPQASHTLTV